MSTAVRAIRGATTLDQDQPDHLTERVQELVAAVYQANGLSLDSEDVISVEFTGTADISSKFPASAARGLGLGDVPLFGAQELSVDGMLPWCVRLILYVNTEKSRSAINHVFLHDATALRPDLVSDVNSANSGSVE